MGMKTTIMNVALGTDDDIIIVDAEREYGTLARSFGGEVVEISPHSIHHLNPLEIVEGYELSAAAINPSLTAARLTYSSPICAARLRLLS